MAAVVEPQKIWWTTPEIATACLPGLPKSRQGVEKIAKAGWRAQAEFARRREGRGGGWEYHWRLFPLPARKRLLAGLEAASQPKTRSRDAVWTWFEGLSERVKAKARARLHTVQAVEALEQAGLTRLLAVAEAARSENVGVRTVWTWLEAIEGVEPHDWLAHLAPRHSGSGGGRAKAELDARFFDALKADYLRLEAPPFTDSYRRASKIARHQGWRVAGERHARREMQRQVPKSVRVFAREGWTGLQKHYPPQIRSRAEMCALSHVNADCHKWDVFVKWPGRDEPVRPQIVAFQDTYSGFILSWRIDWSPNKVAVMAAFGDLVEEWGVPEECLFDNGMEFANKWLTGGAQHRFRFKIREDEAVGVLEQMGIKMHFARPAHGQAKPVERAFRDFAKSIAQDPRFAGAYVGNRPDAKPENYGSNAVPLDLFLSVVEEGIQEHNARVGRRSETANGRSFQATFEESYQTVQIRKATEEQRRLWLMGQEERKLQAKHGVVTLHKNEYYAPWMLEHAGRDVVVRFAPEDLHASVYVYSKSGGFLGEAECRQKTGFRDLASAREDAARLSRERKAHQRYLKELRPQTVDDVAAMLSDAAEPSSASAEAKVIRPEFGTRKGDMPAKPAPRRADAPNPAVEARQEAMIEEFRGKTRPETPASPEQDNNYARFRRAQRVEAALQQGAAVGEEELEWLRAYQLEPEYKSLLSLHQQFGDAMFAG